VKTRSDVWKLHILKLATNIFFLPEDMTGANKRVEAITTMMVILEAMGNTFE
jgi:hypothetical protein